MSKTLSLSLADIEKVEQWRKYNRIELMFPETGAYNRSLYPQHMQFFRETAKHKEVAFIAGNRTGKSEAIVYAATLFLTGRYPSWWEGRRFDKPVSILVAGENSKLVRDSIQAKFFGGSGEHGTGMIPKDLIIGTSSKAGTADAIDTVQVKHMHGVSTMGFGSYDAGREAFQATTRDVILLDEEPPMAIYTECLIRTMTTKGLVMAALTPLKGITELIRYFMSTEQIVGQPS